MRTEAKIREHLEWLKDHCQRYDHGQRDETIAQFMTLLWVLGDEPNAARGQAEAFWDASRDERRRG
jgi:hypothetical protein